MYPRRDCSLISIYLDTYIYTYIHFLPYFWNFAVDYEVYLVNAIRFQLLLLSPNTNTEYILLVHIFDQHCTKLQYKIDNLNKKGSLFQKLLCTSETGNGNEERGVNLMINICIGQAFKNKWLSWQHCLFFAFFISLFFSLFVSLSTLFFFKDNYGR